MPRARVLRCGLMGCHRKALWYIAAEDAPGKPILSCRIHVPMFLRDNHVHILNPIVPEVKETQDGLLE